MYSGAKIARLCKPVWYCYSLSAVVCKIGYDIINVSKFIPIFPSATFDNGDKGTVGSRLSVIKSTGY